MAEIERDLRWHDVKSGLVAELKICCPECMEECVIEFDSQELDGATEVRMPCDGCGLTLSAYLAATVQQQGQLSLPPAEQRGTPPLLCAFALHRGEYCGRLYRHDGDHVPVSSLPPEERS